MAFEGVRRKKRSSILVFLVLFVSFCFLIISLSVVGSISETNHEMFQIVYGDWDYAILNGREEDAAFLAEKQEEGLIETLGRMENYGTIYGLEGWVGFGTLDEGMIEAGRLSLEGGRWPQAENEIALEASTLRSLGVEPEVGQTVTLTVELPRPPAPVTVDCTFTVSGIIREYSSLWMFNYNKTGKLPVSAVVTEETAQEVLRQARAQVPDGEKIQPFPQYFAAAPEDNLLRLQLGGQLDAYLKETRDVSTEDIKAATNPVSSLSVQQTNLNGFYFGLILWVTMLAVACAYLLQLPSEQHRFAVLRSIGATREQLAGLIGAETLILALPAALLAIPGGALGTKLALALLVFSSDSLPVVVAIPWGQLALAALLWVLAILAARFVLFGVVMAMPLTGRFSLKARTARRLRLLRGGMAAGLLSLFGLTVIFCSFQVLRYQNQLESSSDQPYYSIHRGFPAGQKSAEETAEILAQTYFSQDGLDTLFGTVSQQDRAFFEAIPGTQLVYGFTNLTAGLSFEGMEERTVRVIGLDAELWDKAFAFGPDREAFDAGELVLVCLPGEDLPDRFLIDCGKEPDQRVYLKPEEDLSSRDYLEPEGSVTLDFYANDGTFLGSDAPAVSVRRISYEMAYRYTGLMRTNYFDPYTVICSETYLENLLASLPAGQRLGPLVTGEALGYSQLHIRLETYANSSVADSLISAYCLQEELNLNNQRQFQSALDIQAQQQIILMGAAGIAAALMILLILTGLLALESEQELFSFSILRRIGMSAAQQRTRVLGKVTARGLLAAVSGWGLFFLVMVVQIMISEATPMPEIGKEASFISPLAALTDALETLQREGIGLYLAAALTLVCLLVPLAVLLIGKARLLKGKVEV